jgi:hypothetical protein
VKMAIDMNLKHCVVQGRGEGTTGDQVKQGGARGRPVHGGESGGGAWKRGTKKGESARQFGQQQGGRGGRMVVNDGANQGGGGKKERWADQRSSSSQHILLSRAACTCNALDEKR